MGLVANPAGVRRVTDNNDRNFISDLRALWPVIAAVLACVVAFSSLETQAKVDTARIDKLELLAPALDSRLARVETGILDLKESEEQNHAIERSSLSGLTDKLDRLSTERNRAR